MLQQHLDGLHTEVRRCDVQRRAVIKLPARAVHVYKQNQNGISSVAPDEYAYRIPHPVHNATFIEYLR